MQPQFRSLTEDEALYRSVLPGMRLAQLYAFWLVLEILLRVPIAVLIGGTYFAELAVGNTPEPPETDQIFVYIRGWGTLVLLACAWFAFAHHARFRYRPLALAIGTLVPVGNLIFFYQILVSPTGIMQNMIALNPAKADQIANCVWLVLAGWAVFHVQFMYIGLRGQRRLADIDDGRRRLLSEFAPGSGWFWPTTALLLYLPPILRFARRKVATAALLIIAGVENVINYWLMVMAYMLGCLAFAFYAALSTPGAELETVAAILIASGLLLSSALFFRLVVRVTSRLARRFMRRSLEEAQALDNRAPVLFLRSFLDDQVALKAPRFRWEQWLFDASSRRANLDHIVMTEGSALGPTVALGDPSDAAPPYGAARGYFDHSDWQDAVARLCDDAQAIIMTLDGTEGVAWEIGHLRERRHRAKTLYLLRPDDVGAPEGARLIAKVIGDAPTSAEPVFGFEIDEAGAPTLLTAAAPSAYLYQIAVRSFLRRISCSDAA